MNQSKFKPMQLIHAAFCLAIVCFALAAFLVVKDRLFFNPSIDKTDPFYPLFPIMAFIFIILGVFLFNKQLSAIDPESSADEKIARYQTAFLIRCAFLEAGALLNVVAFLQQGNTVFVLVTAVILIVFISQRPVKQNVIDALNLQYPDTEKL